MSRPDPIVKWRIPPEADLRHRQWEGEHVFYHGAAGDTHRLSAPAAAVLLELMAGPTDEARLARVLRAQTESLDDDAAEALPAILQELVRIECVEQAL